MRVVKVDIARVAAASRHLADQLRARTWQPGQRIAIYCGNNLAFVVARQAATALEAVAVPINPRLVADEVAYVLQSSAATVIVVDAEHEAAATAAAGDETRVVVVEPTPVSGSTPSHSLSPTPTPCPAAAGEGDRTAVGATLIYTSGTTGLPKGCLRLEAQERARADELISTYSLGAGDVHLIACPLAHSAPGIFLRAGMRVGADTYILPRFRAEEFLAAVQQVRATFFFLVPTQYERLMALPAELRASYDTSSIRVAIVAGAPIAAATKRRLVDWLGQGVLWEFYGSSETGSVAVLPPAEQLIRPGSVGRPPAGVDVRLVDETGEPVAVGAIGEIFVRSATVMQGYLGQPAADGFISVGDMGRLDDDGYLYLVDRKHDTIISGGLNVYPAEVERALKTHPAVLGAVTFGVDDPDWGQIVAAAVTSDGSVDAAALRAFLRTKIAAYKLPKAIAFIDRDELPVGSSGKPLRRAARQLLAGDERLVRYA